MNKTQLALVAIVLVAAITSVFAAYPLTNVALHDNESGWFTIDNLESYGDDLDSRVGPGEVIFTGHPSYVMNSDNARLWRDLPRVQYYAYTFNDTYLGDALYENLTTAFRDGTIQYAISGTMTRQTLRYNNTAEAAFTAHYCRVETDGLYARTDANLYRWVANSSVCPPERRPDVRNMSR